MCRNASICTDGKDFRFSGNTINPAMRCDWTTSIDAVMCDFTVLSRGLSCTQSVLMPGDHVCPESLSCTLTLHTISPKFHVSDANQLHNQWIKYEKNRWMSEEIDEKSSCNAQLWPLSNSKVKQKSIQIHYIHWVLRTASSTVQKISESHLISTLHLRNQKCNSSPAFKSSIS